jgi:hypothetical protein
VRVPKSGAQGTARPTFHGRRPAPTWMPARGIGLGISLPTPSVMERAFCLGPHTSDPGNAHAPNIRGYVKELWPELCSRISRACLIFLRKRCVVRRLQIAFGYARGSLRALRKNLRRSRFPLNCIGLAAGTLPAEGDGPQWLCGSISFGSHRPHGAKPLAILKHKAGGVVKLFSEK